MKKIKMTIAATMFCAAAFAGYTAYDKATMTDQEKLLQANLEALTSDEHANKNDAIWNVEYKNHIGTDGVYTEINCLTGGKYEC